MTRTCKNCEWWDVIWSSKGYCNNPASKPRNEWMTIREHDFSCGEFKEKDKEE